MAPVSPRGCLRKWSAVRWSRAKAFSSSVPFGFKKTPPRGRDGLTVVRESATLAICHNAPRDVHRANGEADIIKGGKRLATAVFDFMINPSVTNHRSRYDAAGYVVQVFPLCDFLTPSPLPAAEPEHAEQTRQARADNRSGHR